MDTADEINTAFLKALRHTRFLILNYTYVYGQLLNNQKRYHDKKKLGNN